MAIDVPSFLIGAAAGTLIVAALILPRLGRVCVRMLGSTLLASAAGLLTWATVSLATGEAIEPLGWGPISISRSAEAYAWGATTLVAGGLSLGLSFLRSGQLLPPGQRS